MLSPERQSIWMSKITNDGLTRSGTGYFIAVPDPYGNRGVKMLTLCWFFFMCIIISSLHVIIIIIHQGMGCHSTRHICQLTPR